MFASAHRPPAVAGLFYPAQGSVLRAQLAQLLTAVPAAEAAACKAVIVPHAGFIYSGLTAAHAYAALRAQKDRIRRVVLLGPAHRVPVRGLALPGCAAFDTPLGTVAVDLDAVTRIRDLPQVVESAKAHAHEHALEVQLPFLLEVLGAFTLLPLVVGDASAEEVAEVLERVWGGPETLIVISSDLSHYLPYAQARRIDAGSVESMLRLEPTLDHEQACGATPVNGLLLAARCHRLRPHLLDLRNSGDTAGDRARVVGYAALAFFEDATAPGRDLGEAALSHAREAIAERLALPVPAACEHPGLATPAASFVTLRRRGSLRGCTGSLIARLPLRADVRRNARSAAFEDRRFAPLEPPEFRELRIEVSLLSALEPLAFADEAEALARLRPGDDGVVLECGARHATFLPQVWEQLPEPEDFLGELKRKAGLRADFWSPELRLSRYTVTKWRERAGASS